MVVAGVVSSAMHEAQLPLPGATLENLSADVNMSHPRNTHAAVAMAAFQTMMTTSVVVLLTMSTDW